MAGGGLMPAITVPPMAPFPDDFFVAPPFRVLVTGGRGYVNGPAVFAALNHLDSRRLITEVIHGAADGADKLADDWALVRGRDRTPRGADWDRYRAAAGRNPAGVIRNGQMLAEHRPDIVVAFPGGTGTADMVKKARAAGVPVWEPYP